MSPETPPNTTSDERLAAALAHFFGVLGALAVWLIHKDRSAFVRFQALQALAFEALLMALNMLVVFGVLGLTFLGAAGILWFSLPHISSLENAGPALLAPFVLPFLLFACIMPWGLAIFLIRVIAAASVASGHDFRYPWLGRALERFLSN